jgi:hypothetical protein
MNRQMQAYGENKLRPIEVRMAALEANQNRHHCDMHLHLSSYGNKRYA